LFPFSVCNRLSITITTSSGSKSGKATEVDIPGYALRFPRLEKFRDDKRKEEVTTVKEVEKLFAAAKK
jgi:hypothetical protein